MDRIRVVLAQMPRMLQDVVRLILSGQPDMEVDGGVVSERDITSAASIHGADVMILSELTARTDEYADLLYEHPRLRIVAIDDDGRRAELYELRPHRSPLGELSPDALVQAVRGQRVHGGRS